jgi:NAD+ synthase (glutamine-hydrolysing)
MANLPERNPARSITSVTIAIAQLNCVVGDLAGNAAKILDYAGRAKTGQAALLLTPELALCGYPPEDLLLRDGFYRDCAAALTALASRLGELGGIDVVVGHPHEEGGRRYNAASLLRGGRVTATYFKHALPNYTVFDEQRYFAAGTAPCVFELAGTRFGINICEDTWADGVSGATGATGAAGVAGIAGVAAVAGDLRNAAAPALARQAGAEVLLVLNASPYHVRKQESRYDVMRERVAETGMPLVYANLVGGQDELVFDGASFVLAADGSVACQLPSFEEVLELVSFVDGVPQRARVAPDLTVEAEIYQALCLGVKDYIGKNGFPGALLGLSGGVDSALTLAIACDALGADKVRAVMMPSQYTADISVEDSREMVKLLGVRYDEIPIKPVFDAFLQSLSAEFAGRAVDATEENLQARTRGTIMMALSNKFGSIVLTTGNKSEMAVGYATLYGDMAGGFAVLKDLTKVWVYRLCSYRNGISRIIPERILTRAPSAELRPNQTDQDSLPAYEVLDPIIAAYMENDASPADIVAQGFRVEDVKRIVELIHRNEYKRRQAPIGIRITHRGFGKDWRYPITSRYRERYE